VAWKSRRRAGESSIHDYDKSTKWLIQHHGDAILRLAGVRDIAAWTPLQAEPVLARRLPEGFIEVRHRGETEPDPYIVNDRRLFEILGGRQVMIESQSPILQELEAEWTRKAAKETTQRAILKLLGIRFGLAANEIGGQLHDIDDDVRLNELFESAATCPDLDSFREQLTT